MVLNISSNIAITACFALYYHYAYDPNCFYPPDSFASTQPKTSSARTVFI